MARIIDEPIGPRPAVVAPRRLRTAFPITHPPRTVARPVGGGPPVIPGHGGAGGGAGASGPPDYMALLRQSPAYQQWLANANFRKTGLANARAASIRQLALQFGGLPQGFRDTLGDLRPEDLAAAGANQFGALQTIQRNYEQGRNDMHRSLAARGMLQSGDLGYGEGQATLQRGQQEYEAGQSFMGALQQAINDWTQGVGNVGSEEAGLIAQLLPQIRELYPYTPGTPGAGAPPAGGGAGAAPAVGTPSRPLAPVTHATRATLRQMVAPRRAVAQRPSRPRQGRRPA
jgi:hypothetical protein